MKRRSIRLKMFVIIIGILVPTNLITLWICNDLLVNMKQSILVNQKNEMRMFADQIDARLRTTENFITATLSDDRWLGIRYPQGSAEYELAKNNLWAAINNQFPLFSIVDGIYGYVGGSEESFTVRDITQIKNNDNERLLSWIEHNTIVNKWSLVRLEGVDYLVLGKSNTKMDLGIIVKKDTIISEWQANSSRPIDIVQADSTPNREGYYKLETALLDQGLTLVCYVPMKSISSEIPFRYYMMFSTLIFGIFISAIVFALMERIVERPLNRMKQTIHEIEQGNTQCRITEFDRTKEFYSIQKAFNKLMDHIYDLKIKAYEMELENQKAQLTNLQLQINPHFLLNSLNTIYGMSEIGNPAVIQKFTLNLVRYLRYSLQNTDRLVSLKKELEFINAYMEIQKIRYPDKFFFMYDVDEVLMDELIPPLLIENFVENSAKYAPNNQVTEISVIVKKKEGSLNLSICDDGIGISATVLAEINAGHPIEDEEGTHVGIWNCQRRLKLFYGGEALFSISSMEGEGTQVWMEIPSKRGENG